MYKCHCCGKELKTEAGFKKHFCKFQQRFIEIETNNWYPLWLKFKTIFKIKTLKNTNKEYFSFIHSPIYTNIINFFKWANSSNIIDVSSYMQYLKDKQYPIKDWCNDNLYREYLKKYLTDELPMIAVDRAKTYLKNNNTDIKTISPNNLYFSILSGNISNKYLKYANINVKDILDNGQYNDVKDLLV